MPIPIRPINSPDDKNQYVDYSFLTNQIPKIENNRMQVTASNQDADLLMKIWLKAQSQDNKFIVSNDLNISSKELTRLKTYGLITGTSNEIEITARGKKVITVMALGEGNKFENGRTEKNYKEILANMDIRGKSGYRIPKFCANTSNNLNVTDAFKQ